MSPRLSFFKMYKFYIICFYCSGIFLIGDVRILYEDLLKKILEVLRIQRHDFMNHLQVIYGYIQLGNLEKAKEYSLITVDSVEKFGKFSKIPLPCLQSYLLWLSSQFAYIYENIDYISDGDWQEWQREDVDEELTRLFINIFSVVQDSLKNKGLKYRLRFTGNLLKITFLFVGEKDENRDCISSLKKLNFISELLKVGYTMNSPDELVISVKLGKIESGMNS